MELVRFHYVRTKFSRGHLILLQGNWKFWLPSTCGINHNSTPSGSVCLFFNQIRFHMIFQLDKGVYMFFRVWFYLDKHSNWTSSTVMWTKESDVVSWEREKRKYETTFHLQVKVCILSVIWKHTISWYSNESFFPFLNVLNGLYFLYFYVRCSMEAISSPHRAQRSSIRPLVVICPDPDWSELLCKHKEDI